MADTREILIDWLRDAHAMERASADNLEHQVDHLGAYPDLKQKYVEQIALTRRQTERIDRQLEALGTNASSLKDAAVRMAGHAQALLAGIADDEVVKQATSTLAYENWEIANFRALAAAAEHENEPTLKAMFEDMAREKADMAVWLAAHIPDLTHRWLDSQAAG